MLTKTFNYDKLAWKRPLKNKSNKIPSRPIVRMNYTSKYAQQGEDLIKPCISCRHARIACVHQNDKTPQIVCSLFSENIDPVTGKKSYRNAYDARLIGQDDPDACGREGRLYQKRMDEAERVQFNIAWFAAWAQILSQK